MRCFLLIGLAGCLSLSMGCMVLDEVDAANAKMNKRAAAKKGAQPAQPAANPAAAAAAKTSALLEQSKQWWDSATSLAPAEVESGIVSCRLREGTQFMAKEDCLARGGTPSKV